MRTLMTTGTLCLALLLGPALSLAAGGTTDPKPESTAELFDRAIQAIDEQRYMGALAVLSRVVFETPDDADAWNYIGFSQRKLGRFDRALEAYNRALSLKPDHRGALEYLGELYVETNQMEKAQLQLQRLIEVCGADECKERVDLENAIAGRQSSKR